MRVLPGHLDLAHVADVEEAGRGAHRHVLGGDAAVLHRHVPAGEVGPSAPWRRDGARAGCVAERWARRAVMKGVLTGQPCAIRRDAVTAANQEGEPGAATRWCAVGSVAHHVEHLVQARRRHASVLLDVLRAKSGRRAAGREEEILVTESGQLLQPACGQHDARAPVALRLERGVQPADAIGVETVPRLVEHDQRQRMAAEFRPQTQELPAAAARARECAAARAVTASPVPRVPQDAARANPWQGASRPAK